MNWETLVAYAVGLLSTLVCAAVFFLLGMAFGYELAAKKYGKEKASKGDDDA